MKNKIYFEFPSFGYGPASTSINIIESLINNFNFEVTIISDGVSLEFAKNCIKAAKYIEFDTSDVSIFDRLICVLDKDSLIISNTNIDFCKWCIENGYRIIGIDTLFWMWNEDLTFISKMEGYIIQDYFSDLMLKKCNNKEYKDKLKITSPLVNYKLIEKNRTNNIRQKEVLIAFGGMATPYNKDVILKYYEYILRGLLNKLNKCDRVDIVHIVGGLVNKNDSIGFENQNLNIIYEGPLEPERYINLLSCEYVFICPGLTSIYEACAINAYTYILPGFSVSHILQAMDLEKCTGYEYIGHWPKSAYFYDKVKEIPENEGTALLQDYLRKELIKNTIYDFPKLEDFLYKMGNDDTLNKFYKLKENWNELKNIDEYLLDILLKEKEGVFHDNFGNNCKQS